MNKRAFGIVATSAIAIAALAAPAAAGSAPKTTGDVEATQIVGGVPAHMVWVAQDSNPDKGSFTYTDPNGTYTVAVEDVQIDGDEGDFAGRVVSSTFSWIVRGDYLGVAVLDGGEPAVGADRIIGAIYADLDSAIGGYDSLSAESPNALVATAGNLQVR